MIGATTPLAHYSFCPPQVSALAVSPGGSMMASGQLGTRSFKGYAAPVFVWDTYSRRRTAILRGLSQNVNIISFSPDEKLVCGCGEVT